MKRIIDPSLGARCIRAHRKQLLENQQFMVGKADSEEERLTVAYPGLAAELTRLNGTPAPASFKTVPGKVTGKRLVQLGIPGICPNCYELEANPNPRCRDHPENSGGGNSWLRVA